MKKILLLCCAGLVLLASAVTAYAETAQPVLAAGESDRILLRWVWPEGSLVPPQYRLYRQQLGGGSWELLTPQPLTKVKDPVAAEKILGNELHQKYRQILFPQLPDRKKEPGKYREALLRMKELWGMTMLSADLYPVLADLLGVRYEDFSAEKGKSYVYRLMLFEDGKEQLYGVSLPVSRGESYILPPQGIQGKAADAVVLLRWGLEARFSSYDIYRSDSQEGTYTKVNQHPVVILKSYDKNGKLQLPEWFYIDQNLENGRTYWYLLWGRDPFGRVSRVPRPIALKPRDLTPPAAPIAFKTEVTKDEVLLSWDAAVEEDCAGYNLYRSFQYDKNFEQINTRIIKTGKTTYLDRKLKPETIYWYYVTAVDRSGNESGRSYVAPANVRDWLPPNPPQRLRGEVVPGKVLLSWGENQEKDLAGYRIYQAMEKKAEIYHRLQLEPVVAESFEHSLSSAASTNPYYYKITAVDRSGNESDFSNIIKVKLPDITPPFAPAFKQAMPKEDEIIISWHPNQETDLAGYELYRQEQGDTGGTSKIKLGGKLLKAKKLEFRDSVDLVAGQRYSYSLYAVDRDGNRSLSSRPIVAATFDLTPPGVPKGVKLKQEKNSSKVVVSWKAPKNKDFRGVILYRAKRADGPFYPLTQKTESTSFVDGEVKFDQTYYYRLAAFDQKNNRSEYSKTFKIDVKRPEK